MNLRGTVPCSGWLVEILHVGRDAGGPQEPAIWFDEGTELIVESTTESPPLVVVFRRGDDGKREYLALNETEEVPK